MKVKREEEKYFAQGGNTHSGQLTVAAGAPTTHVGTAALARPAAQMYRPQPSSAKRPHPHKGDDPR